MAKEKKEKNFRKIKRNNSWISILFFALAIGLLAIISFAFVDFVFAYAVDTKASGEYESIKYMARLYDSNANIEEAEKYKLLNEEGREYFIIDNNGEVIYSYGKNTCSDIGKTVYLGISDENVVAYKDTEIGYVYPTNNHALYLDYKSFIKNEFKIDEDGVFIGTRDEGDRTINHDRINNLNTVDDSEYFSELNSLVSNNLPIWLSVDMGDKTLIAKAYITLSANDLALFILMIIVMSLLVLILFIIVIGNVISGFVRQRRITNFFFTDHVTKSHNWMWFKTKGEQFLRRGSTAKNKYAIINLVFVKYRTFCLCHSIEEGEEVLCKVNDLILSKLEKKEMCAHVTNSNFALLLHYTDADDLDARIKSLITELEQIDTEHKFAFQAGINKLDIKKDENGKLLTRKDIDIDKEYNNACAARATFEGSEDSGVAYFDNKLVEEQKWIDMVQEKQQQALDNEEFQVYYQPKYDPRTNELRGAEALIRWQSPEYGFVSPGRIIPIFEKNGFITEIDHYMIQHVAKDQKAWLDKGLKCVPVSVNVSRAHFIESDLAEQIRDMIDKEGTPHNLIEIELTESAFFDDKNAMINTIEKLKSYGFAVSMDDFGSGYSSLNSLKDMPLDVLKLDAEFFRGDNDNNRGEIVVTEAIKLAKSLNMRTVAEGVEIKEQVDFLAEQGCDMIQGYYFAKPMPKDEYEQRMSN